MEHDLLTESVGEQILLLHMGMCTLEVEAGHNLQH